MQQIPNLTMNNGMQIPQIGFGLWQMKDEAACKQAIKWALGAGYRHFDTAQIYGNEQFLGTVLREAEPKREEIFITTKIWNNNQRPALLLSSFEQSLQKLQTTYVDLLLLHFPVTALRAVAWRELEELAKRGTAKAIGVSNYTVRHLEELLQTCTIKPAVNQVELHVFLQQPELVAYCQQQGIVLEAYSPLAHGQGMDDPTLLALATKHNKTPAQIMLRWCVEIGTVPLPKSAHQDRITRNLAIFDFALDADDMQRLKSVDKNFRTAWDPTNVA